MASFLFKLDFRSKMCAIHFVPFHNQFVPIPPSQAMQIKVSLRSRQLEDVGAQSQLLRDSRSLGKPLLHADRHQVIVTIAMNKNITMTTIRYRKHEVTIELMSSVISKQEKQKVLKVTNTMGFKITMGDFISTSYLVNLTVDPSSTTVRMEGTKEARKVLAEHLERMVEKSHGILVERGELEMLAPVSNHVERPDNNKVGKKIGNKGGNGSKGAAPCAPPSAPPSAPPTASLPECPVCLQEMAPGAKIFQVSSSLVDIGDRLQFDGFWPY